MERQRIFFFKGDGTPRMIMEKDPLGRCFYFHDEDYNRNEEPLEEGDTITFHEGYGTLNTYIVEAADSEIALLRHIDTPVYRGSARA